MNLETLSPEVDELKEIKFFFLINCVNILHLILFTR